MPNDDRQFFWPLYGHLELVDDQGRQISTPGKVGEIVGTGYDNAVMPLIRYRTGDSGAYSTGPAHPALPGFPVLDRIEGRLQEFVVTHDERLISVCTLGAAHFEDLNEVEEMQYVQHTPGKVTIRVTSQHILSSAMKEKFARAVEDKTQGGCSVEIVQVDDIPRSSIGKRQMIEQNLDLTRYFSASSIERN
jgi:phenylacetate-CoA ligase